MALFIAFGLEGEVFHLVAFLFFPPVETSLATSEVGSMGADEDCVGLYTIEFTK